MTMTRTPALVEETPFRWRIDREDGMRVPGIVFASRRLLPDLIADRALEQVVNVAMLPGIVEASYAMPDVHWGYGFPIGGVAATDVDAGGVVSPGGVGFDISCGVRLLIADIDRDAVISHLPRLMDQLGRDTPRGVGGDGVWKLAGQHELTAILRGGARFAVERGHGTTRDLGHCEDGGVLEDADPGAVSVRARERGLPQVGSLGAGNHFLEVQVVDAVSEPALAPALGLRLGGVCVMIHSGSRGLGHQVCSDHVRVMAAAMRRYGIDVPDRQLASVPVQSPEGSRYLGAMAAATNYGRANRQLLTESTRKAFRRVLGDVRLDVLYDVSHNLAKLEEHTVQGAQRLLCVHRKGATRALPPGHPELHGDFAATGQPVLVPGSMGTASHVLAGVSPGGAFFSTCHGAGRTMSRHEARRRIDGRALREQLESAGVAVRPGSYGELAEEAPFAYKDVDEVVAICEQAGLAQRVARLVPIGVVKG
jgi:tRNA-splicing ligase RtcB